MKSAFRYIIAIAAFAMLAAFVFALPGCRKKPVVPEGQDAVIDISGRETDPARAVTAGPSASLTPELTSYAEPTSEPTATHTPSPTPKPTPTPAPTPTPRPEEWILSGHLYPLNNGDPIGYGWPGERIDLDGDGSPEYINIRDVDGGLTLCIDDEPFLADDFRVYLVSLDGRRIVFLVERVGARQDGYSIFYPDPYGNLYCRLFGVVRHGKPEDFVMCSSYEDYIKHGLDIMLLNPLIYSSTAGGKRTILLDMDGDGAKDEIVIDGSLLTINGYEDERMLATTLPRFFYDPDRNAIGLYGSGGDYAIRLWLHADSIEPDVSYVKLL